MSTNKVNVDGVMLFEQRFVRVRQTALGVGTSLTEMHARHPTRIIAKHFVHPKGTLSANWVTYRQRRMNSRSTQTEAMLTLRIQKINDGMIARVENLKRKVGSSCIVRSS